MGDMKRLAIRLNLAHGILGRWLLRIRVISLFLPCIELLNQLRFTGLRWRTSS